VPTLSKKKYCPPGPIINIRVVVVESSATWLVDATKNAFWVEVAKAES
jgi:hypothetical protein